jgi:uncharacterized protein HemX
MRKITFSVLSFLLIIALTGCGGSGFSHGQIKRVLEAEGLQVKYTDNMEENHYEYKINEKAILIVRVLDNAKEVEKAKEDLERNAKEKQYEVETFGVKHLLLAYYPPEEKDIELENKIRTAISKIEK